MIALARTGGRYKEGYYPLSESAELNGETILRCQPGAFCDGLIVDGRMVTAVVGLPIFAGIGEIVVRMEGNTFYVRDSK